MNRSKFVAVIFLSFLMLSAFSFYKLPSAVGQDNEIKIGIVTARSGALSYYGDMSINGFILGLMYGLNITKFEIVTPNMEWNLTWGDKVIHIIAADTVPAGQQVPDPATASSAAEDLILNKGVDILLGTSYSPAAIAVTEIAKKYEVVFLVTPAADHEITKTYLNKYVFQISSNTWHDALTGAKWAVENMGKTFAFLAPSNTWGRSTVETWKSVIESENGTVLVESYAPITTTDFTPYIQAVIASGAEVFIPVWAGSGAFVLYQQINASGLYQIMNVTSGIPDLATLNLAGMAQYLPNYLGMMKYCWNLPQNNPVNEWLVNKYVELYKKAALPTMGSVLLAFPLPDLFVGNGFIAGHALALALKKTNGQTDAESLISALENLEFYSAKGNIKIRKEDHRTIQDMYIAQLVWENESLHKYYSYDELPDLYKPFYTLGIFSPKYIATIANVTPPIEVNLYKEEEVTPPAMPGWIWWAAGALVVVAIVIIIAAVVIKKR